MERTVSAESEAKHLQSLDQTKRERARQTKRQSQLGRATGELERSRRAIADLEEDRQRLLVELAASRAARDEAFSERDSDLRSRRTLEHQLGVVAGRATYLRRLLPRAIDEADHAARAA